MRTGTFVTAGVAMLVMLVGGLIGGWTSSIYWQIRMQQKETIIGDQKAKIDLMYVLPEQQDRKIKELEILLQRERQIAADKRKMN